MPTLCRDWCLEPGAVLTGGSRSYVCRVLTSDGRPAVLKVALPEEGLNTQLVTLVAAKGRGYVQVLSHNLSRGALLMESLGPSPEESGGRVLDVLSLLAARWDAGPSLAVAPRLLSTSTSGHGA